MDEDTDLCRVAVISLRRRVDLSLPIDVPFADLLPTILRYAGRDLADAGLKHGGWVLQRIDDAPFGASQTPAQVGLRHGETLYLRPAGHRIPDLCAADQAAPPPASAGAPASRWPWGCCLGFAVAASAAAATVAARSSHQLHLPGAAELAVCLAFLLAGLAGQRISSHAWVGLVLGLAALPHAFLAGLFGTHTSGHLAPADVALGFGSLAAAALICAVLMRDSHGVFAGITTAAVAALAATGIAAAAHQATGARIAAVTVTALALGVAARQVALLAARPHRDPEPSAANHAPARQWSNAAALALAMAGLGGLAFLAFAGKGLSSLACGLAAGAFLLQSGTFAVGLRRLAVLTSGIAGLMILAVGSTKNSSVAVVSITLALLVAGSLLAAVAALSWRHLSQEARPWLGYLTRMADVLGALCALALVPVMLGLLGV